MSAMGRSPQHAGSADSGSSLQTGTGLSSTAEADILPSLHRYDRCARHLWRADGSAKSHRKGAENGLSSVQCGSRKFSPNHVGRIDGHHLR
jgi:hypothetical protein